MHDREIKFVKKTVSNRIMWIHGSFNKCIINNSKRERCGPQVLMIVGLVSHDPAGK